MSTAQKTYSILNTMGNVSHKLIKIKIFWQLIQFKLSYYGIDKLTRFDCVK